MFRSSIWALISTPLEVGEMFRSPSDSKGSRGDVNFYGTYEDYGDEGSFAHIYLDT